jgi:hypothetical protein
MLRARFLLLPATLLLSLGCVQINNQGTQALTVSGQYRDPGTNVLKPARYCYAEVYDLSTGTVADSGYLGANGQGTFQAPDGDTLQVRLYARVEVPDGASFTLRGSVKGASLATTYANADAFNAVADASVTSTAGTGTSLSLVAEPDAAQTNQAFNAADQMVAFGQGLRTLQPGLKLPNLHAFFTASTNVTGYPTVVRNGGNQVLTQSSGRAIFALPVAGNGSGAANTNNDLGDDAVLLEAYSHLLFADHSLQETGASALSYLRRDNDDQWVDRPFQSEPTIAFTTGFGDFLAAACRSLDGASNPHLITDTYVNGSGASASSTFDLTNHGQFSRITNQGEFYRGSVAISLWQTWRVALGGSTSALQTLWAATGQATNSNEFLRTPFAGYPSYLLGLKNLLGPASLNWSNTLFQLSQEDVQDPSPAYFLSGALWTAWGSLPQSTSGSFPVYTPATGINFDRNQAAAFTFVHGGGPRTVTLSTSSPGLVLELFDTQGLYSQTVATSSGNGILNFTSLPAGTYGVRARVDYLRTYANGNAPWTLTVN